MLSLVLAVDGEGPTLMCIYHLCPHRRKDNIFVAELSLSKSEILQAGWGSAHRIARLLTGNVSDLLLRLRMKISGKW